MSEEKPLTNRIDKGFLYLQNLSYLNQATTLYFTLNAR